MIKAASFCINMLLILFTGYAITFVYPTESLMLRPLDFKHSIGILTSSLVHENIKHLIYNALALAAFSFFLIKENQIKHPIRDFLVLIVASNAILFLIGNSEYYYLGSSNLVYGLVGFSIGSLIFNKCFSLVIPLALFSGLLITGLTVITSHTSYLSHYLGVGFGIIYFLIQRFILFKNFNYE